MAFRERRKEPAGLYWRVARRDPLMDHRAATLTDERIRELAARFAAFPCRPTTPIGVASPAKLKRCDYCHGVDGSSLKPWAPSLAGQKEAYLRDQMTLYRDVEIGPDTRLHPIMGRRALELDDDEIAAFARYFSSFGGAGSG